MASFLPYLSSGAAVDHKLHETPEKKTRKRTTFNLHPSSPSQQTQYAQGRCTTVSMPPRRASWLVTPAHSPTTRPSSKLSRRSPADGAECKQGRRFRQRRSNSFVSFGTQESIDFSLGDSSSREFRCMSNQFPMTSKTEKVVFQKQTNQRGIVIETSEGEIIGSIDVINDEGTTRLLKDASGKTCAVILQTLDKSALNTGHVFKVYNNKPAVPRQQASKHKIVHGLYLWAEIKNTGAMGGKFVMKRYSSETSSCSADKHTTKWFGSLFSKVKSKGYTFLDSHKKECVKMFSLENRAKGILIAPNRDMCLMMAYCAVVDEMVQQRMR